MSWAPPSHAKPNCAKCSYRKPTGVSVTIERETFALVDCHLASERRYVFRKNPPRPDLESYGVNCKRYYPEIGAAHPQGEGWVEFPATEKAATP